MEAQLEKISVYRVNIDKSMANALEELRYFEESMRQKGFFLQPTENGYSYFIAYTGDKFAEMRDLIIGSNLFQSTFFQIRNPDISLLEEIRQQEPITTPKPKSKSQKMNIIGQLRNVIKDLKKASDL